MILRPINPQSKEEILLVATRMKNTLVDVLGQSDGESIYSMEWLVDRVSWHISLAEKAQILLACVDDEIVGQAIVRIESEPFDYGFFSTIYVVPEHRRKGVAKLLIESVIQWCVDKDLPYMTYNTAHDNLGLIQLLESFGFEVSLKEKQMVQLRKSLK